ncbi:metallophosphoesterase [Pelagicoccus sp. SDUM812002]|uniref:metallophosphoesterase family protein n=1 Tax=Pelagicoccus sp. SDUM812002 TaxID=3041266 RepID=UPI0028109BBA|nr:metallophosphoesterase [Pelagicoccus sp. SDUM812002]MDQ8188341.1 metallophosphoesterase [Pelagicoccus sp. SDUM812002]
MTNIVDPKREVASSATKPARLAHISDLHFGRCDPAVSESLLQDLRDHQPGLIVISGDLTMRARNSEFEEAMSFIERLPSPWLCVPGNHDIPHYNLIRRVVTPFKRYRRYVGDELMPRLETENYAIIGLNTTRSFSWKHLDWSRGRVNMNQLATARAWFDDIPRGKPRIVFGHHPFILPDEDPSRGTVGRLNKALTSFAFSEVDLLLAGHLHQAFWRRLSVGTSEENGNVHELLALQASTATSDRLRGEANAYHIIDVEPNRFMIELREWTGASFDRRETMHHQINGTRGAES